MTHLDDTQQRLIASVQETYNKVLDTLEELEVEYQQAVFRAKAPVIDAIRAAEEGKVPRIRIAQEGMNMSYVAKMDAWCRPGDVLVRRALEGDVKVTAKQTFTETVAETKAVTRDNYSGDFTVVYNGQTYTVKSSGPATEPWSAADPSIPQGVYDLILSEWPHWTLLED